MSIGMSKDMYDVRFLHGISGSTGLNTESTTRPSWTRPPTAITKPNNRGTSLHNPYSGIRNDLDRTNPSARTLVPPEGRVPSHYTGQPKRSDKPPASKKLKLNKEGPLSGQKKSASSSVKLAPSITSQEMDNISSQKKLRPTFKLSQGILQPTPTPFTPPEIIDVDEDVGVPVSDSSDDLQLHQGERPGEDRPEHTNPSVQDILETPLPSAQHPFNARGQQSSVTYPPLPSGPQTRALTSRISAERSGDASIDKDESDPIEDANDLVNGFPEATHRKRKATPSGHTEFTVGLVFEAVKEFNKNTVSKIPEIDLNTKKRRVGSMKSRNSQAPMTQLYLEPKPANVPTLEKQSLMCSSRKELDDISTSTTYFRRGENEGSKHEREYVLPVEKWICGTQLIMSAVGNSTKHWICVRGEKVSLANAPIDSPKRTLEFELVLSRDIKNVWLPSIQPREDFEECPILGFLVWKTDKSKSLFKNEDTKLVIGVKLLKEHANWDPRVYKSIAEELISSSCGRLLLVPSARRAHWEGIERDSVPAEPSIAPQTARSKPKPRPAYAGARTSPESVPGNGANSSNLVLRRSNRNSSNVTRDSDPLSSILTDETILLYPPTGTGAVNVTRGDLKRLEPGEYLNDTLIEFGLKLWLNKLRDTKPELADQVHVFSSFFYTQLNHKNIEEGYLSVRKWTAKFDLFKKRYIVVPINEHLHWYLAIICYPDRALHHHIPRQAVITRNSLRGSLSKFDSSFKSRQQEHALYSPPVDSKSVSSSSISVTVDEQEIEKISGPSNHTTGSEAGTPPSSSMSALALDTPVGDVVVVTEGESKVKGYSYTAPFPIQAGKAASRSASPAKSHTLSAIHPSSFYASADPNPSAQMEREMQGEVDIGDSDHDMEIDDPALAIAPVEAITHDSPYIFSFDSLGARHPHALKLLSRYLDMEAMDKKDISQTTPAITKQASVPTQPNYCDCGVYLLHFVEQFMSDPEGFTHRIADQGKSKKSKDVNRQERELIWNHDVVTGKRESLKQTLLSLASQWRRDKETVETEKGGGEDEPSVARSKIVAVDNDSDIEVLEMTLDLNEATKEVPVPHKAQRIR